MRTKNMNTKNIFRTLLVAAALLMGANNVKANETLPYSNPNAENGNYIWIAYGEFDNAAVGDKLSVTYNLGGNGNTYAINFNGTTVSVDNSGSTEIVLTEAIYNSINKTNQWNGSAYIQGVNVAITGIVLVTGSGDGGTTTQEDKHYLTFKTSEYCAAKWDSSANTLSWGPSYPGWNNLAWNFMEAEGISGDLSTWTHLHLHVSNWTNASAQELRIVFKEADGKVPSEGDTKEFVKSPNASGDIDIDLGEWGNCDITNIYDLTIYGCARDDESKDASVKITDAYYITNGNGNGNSTETPETETVTIGNTGCITYSNLNSSINFDNVSGLNAYIASAVDLEQNLVTLTQVSGTVAANTGLVLIRESGNTETSFSLPLSSSTGTTYSNNLLVASTNNLTLWHTNTSYTYYVLVQRGNVAKFAEVYSDDAELDAGKAYLRINKVNNARTRGLSIVFSDGTTGISSIENKSDVSVIYNLCGQRVDNPTKGIYIVNGKKVLMK
jgi:hypothetical protein